MTPSLSYDQEGEKKKSEQYEWDGKKRLAFCIGSFPKYSYSTLDIDRADKILVRRFTIKHASQMRQGSTVRRAHHA